METQTELSYDIQIPQGKYMLIIRNTRKEKDPEVWLDVPNAGFEDFVWGKCVKRWDGDTDT